MYVSVIKETEVAVTMHEVEIGFIDISGDGNLTLNRIIMKTE